MNNMIYEYLLLNIVEYSDNLDLVNLVKVNKEINNIIFSNKIFLIKNILKNKFYCNIWFMRNNTISYGSENKIFSIEKNNKNFINNINYVFTHILDLCF